MISIKTQYLLKIMHSECLNLLFSFQALAFKFFRFFFTAVLTSSFPFNTV